MCKYKPQRDDVGIVPYIAEFLYKLRRGGVPPPVAASPCPTPQVATVCEWPPRLNAAKAKRRSASRSYLIYSAGAGVSLAGPARLIPLCGIPLGRYAYCVRPLPIRL